MVNISVKFHKISQSVFILQEEHNFITKIIIYNVQRAITPKVGKNTVMFLVFYTLSDSGKYFCKVS